MAQSFQWLNVFFQKRMHFIPDMIKFLRLGDLHGEDSENIGMLFDESMQQG